jgi:hypothetical protein
MDEIKLHPELLEYMRLFTKEKGAQYLFNSPEYQRCARVYEKNIRELKK